MAEIDVHEIGGNPTREERAVLVAALRSIVTRERLARTPSAWKLAGRALAARSGLLDVRTRMGRPAWPVADRLPRGGLLNAGRPGRGDAL